MVTSLRNLKGRGPSIVPTVLALPTTFPSVAAGTAAAANVLPITIKNTGDAPLTITSIALANSNTAGSQQQVREGERPADFQVLDAAGCTAGAIAPNATCFVNVGFKPTSTSTKSVARLIVVSNADNATESILLNGQSTADATGGVSGNVPTTLSLTLGAAEQLRRVRAGHRPHVRRGRRGHRRQHRRQRDAVGHRPERRRHRQAWSTARSRCRSRCRSTRPTPPPRRPRSPR